MSSKLFLYAVGIILISKSASAAGCLCNATHDGFEDKVECLMNKQIRMEYKAFYFYEALATYFQRPSVALLGFSKFFRKAADEEMGHARQMSEFLNSLGKKVKLESLALQSADANVRFTYAKEAVSAAIAKEEEVSGNIDCVHENANHPAVHVFLDDFIMEQVKSINDLTTLKTRLSKGVDPEIIQFFIDKEF